MTIRKNTGGRPRLTELQKAQRKENLLIRLEAYLKSGLSISKSLREAKVFNSEFYKYMSEDRFFGEKVAKYRQYTSVLANQAIVNELFRIVQKQNERIKNNQPQSLSSEDVEFLWWYALHANACREEWGRRAEVSYDAEEEIHKIKQLIEHNSN